MDYSYTTSGEILVGACAPASWEETVITAFEVGDIAYFKGSALKGYFEKVVIRDIRFPKPYDSTRTRMGRNYEIPLYIDTLNAYYNEEELISQADAADFISDYKIRQELLREQKARNC